MNKRIIPNLAIHFARNLLLPAVLLFLTTVSVAYAGYGVHQNVEQSDICPVCHEHTPVGNVWMSHESIEYNFCTTCHGISAAGADTDVVTGMYDNPANQNGTFGATLNSGGFEKLGGPDGNLTTSTHLINFGDNPTPSPYLIFGSNTRIVLSCTSCHDPDGSNNYRILKATVNGKNVGNYVESNEPGFDDSLSEDPNVYKNYVPNYTTPNYKKPTDLAKGIAGWCAACHENYKSITYETDPKTGRKHYYYVDAQSKKRYHHSVNVPIGQNPTGNTVTNLPLAKALATTSNSDPANLVMCLTCHRVHGTDTTMTERAQVGPTSSAPSSLPGRSALLRMNNRGVCQNCHKK